MATLSVSTNTDYDLLSGQTGDDIITISNARLTICADSRWGQEAPFLIPFDTGTGTVPANGTVITQGSASAVLLGVFTDYVYNRVASTVGGAMPATGIIKVKTITGAHFTTGALTGIGANATGASRPDATFYQLIVSATIGGELYIDGRNVRELAFDTGSGVVPAIGATVSQGGVSGYLLGVYSSMTSAPSVPGSTMPASGFLKFKSVTGGSFSAGALTGITANATGADKVGWIEVIGSGYATASGTLTIPRLGKFRAYGAWYDLGTTSGSAGQTIQLPTNGVGGSTYGTGAWIETGVGTNVYEFWSAMDSTTTVLTATDLGTDGRSKLLECKTDGTLQIGNLNGAGVGYVPPAGCKIRCPNVFMRHCTANTTRGENGMNATTANRPEFIMNSSGDALFDTVGMDWYGNFLQPYALSATNTIFHSNVLINEVPTEVVLNNVGIGYVGVATGGFDIGQCKNGVTITNSRIYNPLSANSQNPLYILNSKDITLTNVHTYNVDETVGTGLTTSASYLFNDCENVVMSNCSAKRNNLMFLYCRNVVVNNYDYTSVLTGSTLTRTGYAMVIGGISSNVKLDGLTFGENGTYANTNPYTGILYVGNATNVTMRNAGTPSAPISAGTGANATAYLLQDAGLNDGILLQRLYFTDFRAGVAPITTVNTTKNLRIDNCWSYNATGASIATNDTQVRNGAYTNAIAGNVATYGNHFQDFYTGATTGRLLLAMNEPTESTASQVTITAGNPQFTSAGSITMPLVGDQVVWETPYYVKGYTAFENTAPTITGGGTVTNITLEYDLDTGSGYSGTWKALSATNLSAETISYSTGFKMKIRATTATENLAGANTILYIRINLTTDATAKEVQWPLATPAVCYTNTVTGSKMAIFDDTTESLLYYGTESGGETCVYPEWNADFSAVVRLRKEGYDTIENEITVDEDGIDLLADQNANGFAGTNPGALGITITNHGATPVTWESKDWSITIKTTDDNLTGAEIAEYIAYNIAQNATFNGFNGFAWGDMIVSAGTDYETERERLFGSAGAELKGVRVVRNDGTTAHPDFTRMQADDGTYYVRPAVATISAPNVLAGSRVQLVNETTATEVYNDVLGGVGFSLTYTDGTDFTDGDLFTMRIAKLGYNSILISGQVTSTGASIIDTQTVDTVYVANGIDGSTVTEFVYDNGSVQIDLDDPDGETTVQRGWAWYSYLLTTSTGIIAMGGFTAVDEANYRVNVDIFDFQLENINVLPVRVSGGYLFKSDGGQVCATTGNTIIMDPGKAYIASSAGLATRADVEALY